MIRIRQRATSAKQQDIPDTPVAWRQLFAYLLPYKLRLIVAFIALVASTALSLVFPAVVSDVIDSVFENTDLALLDSITLLLLLVFLLRSIATFVQNYNLNFVGERIVVDIRQELYAHLQTLSIKFFIERRVGELISRHLG